MPAEFTPAAGEYVILTRPFRNHPDRTMTDAVRVVIPAGSDGMALVRFIGTDDTATVPVTQLSPHPLSTQRGI